MDKIPAIRNNRNILAQDYEIDDDSVHRFNQNVRRILTEALDEIMEGAPVDYHVGTMINVTRKFRSLADTIADGAISGHMESVAKKRKAEEAKNAEEAAPDAKQPRKEGDEE